VEHIPAIHAAKVGMRYPARVIINTPTGPILELDLRALAPGRSPTLIANVYHTHTVAPAVASDLCEGQHTEVVLVEINQDDGHLTASLPADPAWLAWNNGTVRQLAQRIRATGEGDLLPVLADALEEAGCTERALLERCRRPEEDDLHWFVTLLATQE
jgi:hypothetical protein